MKTVKETIDAIFEEECRQNGELAQKCKRAINALAGEYILKILTESNEKHSMPFMCYEEIAYRLRKKEPDFTFKHINEGLGMLNQNGQVRYITDGSTIVGFVLSEEKTK